MPVDLVVSFDLFTTNFAVVRKHSVVYRRNEKTATRAMGCDDKKH